MPQILAPFLPTLPNLASSSSFLTWFLSEEELLERLLLLNKLSESSEEPGVWNSLRLLNDFRDLKTSAPLLFIRLDFAPN